MLYIGLFIIMITACIIICHYIFTILSPNITVVTAFLFNDASNFGEFIKTYNSFVSKLYLTLNSVFSFENYFCSFVIYFGRKW